MTDRQSKIWGGRGFGHRLFLTYRPAMFQLLLTGAVALAVAGCESGEGIRSYQVERTETEPVGSGSANGSPATPAAGLDYATPSGWSPGAAEVSRGGIVVVRDAAFEVLDGAQRVEITVTKLPAAAGSALPNVNRWRGQIGMEPLTAEQFTGQKKSIELGGVVGDYVEMTSSDQTILGVIAEHGGMAWFVKLQGSVELARREQQHFEEFVRSIRWK